MNKIAVRAIPKSIFQPDTKSRIDFAPTEHLPLIVVDRVVVKWTSTEQTTKFFSFDSSMANFTIFI